jgi:hypothetical protein
MASMLFKFLLVIILILFVVVAIQGLISYWIFVASMIVGVTFSSLFYRYVERFFVGELPEIFTFSYGEIGEALFTDDDRKKSYIEGLKEKENRAQAELNKMAQDVLEIKQAYKHTKMRLSTEMYEEARGKHYSARVRRAIKAQLGDDTMMKHAQKRDLSVDWNKFL